MPELWCACSEKKRKPTEASEDTYQLVFGTVVWVGGVIYTACQTCGKRLSDEQKATIEDD